eukprot:UN27674
MNYQKSIFAYGLLYSFRFRVFCVPSEWRSARKRCYDITCIFTKWTFVGIVDYYF